MLLPHLEVSEKHVAEGTPWPITRTEKRHRATAGCSSCGMPSLLEVLRKTDANTDTVLMIGHNPGLQELALMLVGEGHAQARDAMAEKYPTGALAVIDFAIGDWPSVEPGSGFLADFLTPRSLR